MTTFINDSSSDDVVIKFDVVTTLVELIGNILGGASLIANGTGTSQGNNKSVV